jgi:rod shape-determining protein MreD
MKVLLFLAASSIPILVIQTAWIGFLTPVSYKPDLMMILVVWASLRTDFLPGAVFSFLGGALIDATSGSPSGLFPVIYCLAFIICGFYNALLHMDSPLGRTIAVFGLSAGAGLLALLVRYFTAPVEISLMLLIWALLRSLVTGLVSMMVFPLIDQLFKGYLRIIGTA